MHANVHDQRCEGGIQSGATVGVLLDLDRHQLSFYVNEEPQVGTEQGVKHINCQAVVVVHAPQYPRPAL